jgi:hypothetical protein
MTKDLCKFDIGRCDKQAQFYLVYGCLNQHVADTTVCREHLNAFRTMVGAHKMHCGQCPKPIESGQYRLIKSSGKRICIRNLHGETIKIIDNDDYDERFGKLTEGIRGVIDKTNISKDKCPCPQLRRELAGQIKKETNWNQVIIKPRKTGKLKLSEETLQKYAYYKNLVHYHYDPYGDKFRCDTCENPDHQR